jgi:hypothetical protein
MSAVFVSYRRADAQGWAGRLGADLSEAFGEAARFYDLRSIPPGADFMVELERALAQASAALVLIGPAWLDLQNDAGERRLDLPDDVVRLEISSALERTIPVIPVLLGGARMPPSSHLPEPLRSLSRRQAVELSDSRWEYDRGVLFDALEQQAGLSRVHSSAGDVIVARGLNVSDAEIGDVTGVRGGSDSGVPGHVEVLRDAKLEKVKLGDITGVDLGPGPAKP